MMQKKVYLIEYNKNILSYNNNILAFTSKRSVEYVKKHIRYDGNHISQLMYNRYLLKTHYNPENTFEQDNFIPKDLIMLRERRFYNLIVLSSLNNLGIALINSIEDRDDGDLEFNIFYMKDRIPLDTDVNKFNLELLWKI